MYKLEFALKQHTPVIHFQHDHDGATLRATEVKPKLDKFILTKLGTGLTDAERYTDGVTIAGSNKWLVGNGEHPALNYKIKLNTSNLRVETVELGTDYNFAPFFGNMGKNYINNEKGLSLIKQTIINYIICFDEKLAKEIIKWLYDFFFTNNFGTRQGKGFGSFEVLVIKMNGINYDLSKCFKYRYQFKIDIKINPDRWDLSYKDFFSKIDLFYRTLRSGVNIWKWDKNNQKSYQYLYIKSSLYQFLNFKGIQWDKKTIKAHYFNGENSRSYNLMDYRDVLGLSSKERWRSYNATLTKTEAKTKDNKWVVKADKEIDISRYKSPVFFKPIVSGDEVNVYFDVFLCGTEQKNFYKKNFLIDLKPPLALRNKSNLILPIADDLDIVEYLDWAFKNVIIEESKSSKESLSLNGGWNNTGKKIKDSKNSKEILSLKAIYSQLKNLF